MNEIYDEKNAWIQIQSLKTFPAEDQVRIPLKLLREAVCQLEWTYRGCRLAECTAVTQGVCHKHGRYRHDDENA